MFRRQIKFIYKKVFSIFETLVLKERSAHKLSLSFSVGLYIAFSPFLFMHTIMVFASTWLFSLNGAAVFAGAVVNNPWTMVPCHAVGYFLGDLFLRFICRIDPIACNPSWMSKVNGPISKIIGIEGVSFWSFFIGGNLLGVLAGVMLYPIVKPVFARLSQQKYKPSKKTVLETTVLEKDENSRQKQKSVPRLRHLRKTRGGDRPDR